MPSNILTYALIVCGIVIAGLGVTVRLQSAKLDTLRADVVIYSATIGTLQKGIETYNIAVEANRARTEQLLEQSREALRASHTDATSREATIAELLARPLQPTLILGCDAADATILEFYQ